MANPLPLVVLPGDDAVFVATASMTNEDPAYPATNLLTDDPALVAKSTTTSTTVTLTTSSLTALLLGLINTNATTITFNGNSMPIASVDPDGQRIHPWLDRRASPITGTSWTIALSRSSGVVWLGRPVIAQAVYELNLKYGLKHGRRRPGDVEIKTRLGSILRHGSDIRTRWATGSIDVIESESLLKALEASAKGIMLPFLFIPDELTNDAWFVKFTANDFSITIPNYDVREIPFSVEELSSGPPNG